MTAEDIAGVLPLVVILAVFWLVLVRPARRRQKEALALQQSLAVGQRVLTTAGLYATVVGLEDDAVVLETSPGVTSRWARAAVGRVLSEQGSTGDGAPRRGPDLRKGDPAG